MILSNLSAMKNVGSFSAWSFLGTAIPGLRAAISTSLWEPWPSCQIPQTLFAAAEPKCPSVQYGTLFNMIPLHNCRLKCQIQGKPDSNLLPRQDTCLKVGWISTFLLFQFQNLQPVGWRGFWSENQKIVKKNKNGKYKGQDVNVMLNYILKL